MRTGSGNNPSRTLCQNVERPIESRRAPSAAVTRILSFILPPLLSKTADPEHRRL
jgi:hypothetical protein